MPLRDASGTLQVVFSDGCAAAFLRAAPPVESVVKVRGVLVLRPEAANSRNRNSFELRASAFVLLNAATSQLPLCAKRIATAGEEWRLRHRVLDLRLNAALRRNIETRSRLLQCARKFLEKRAFVEVETPLLHVATAAGAREFRVASATTGNAFALPQSPQIAKQMLVAAGFERYFQVARCFRDEEARADRQPEFTQIDVEMAFATAADVRCIAEQLLNCVVSNVFDASAAASVLPPFSVMTHAEAIQRYGSDKPDVRSGNGAIGEICTLRLDPPVASAAGWEVADFWTCTLTATTAQRLAAFGAADADFCAESTFFVSPLHRVSQPLHSAVFARLPPLLPSSFMAVVLRNASSSKNASIRSTLLGRLRAFAVASMCDVASGSEPPLLSPVWVHRFPLFERVAGKGGLHAVHHPFTAPCSEKHLRAAIAAANSADLCALHAQHYDLVLNGVEVAGGSVRIHDASLQRLVFERVLRLEAAAIATFDPLLKALSWGAPPHAGIAFGVDRLLALLCGASSIRDVIAFPKSSSGIDLCFGPSKT